MTRDLTEERKGGGVVCVGGVGSETVFAAASQHQPAVVAVVRDTLRPCDGKLLCAGR